MPVLSARRVLIDSHCPALLARLVRATSTVGVWRRKFVEVDFSSIDEGLAAASLEQLADGYLFEVETMRSRQTRTNIMKAVYDELHDPHAGWHEVNRLRALVGDPPLQGEPREVPVEDVMRANHRANWYLPQYVADREEWERVALSGADDDEARQAASARAHLAPNDQIVSFCRRAFQMAVDCEIPLGVFGIILERTWHRRSRNLLREFNVSYRTIGRMFNVADKRTLMQPSELAAFEALPLEFTAWRGTSGIGAEQAGLGMSWCLDGQEGAWFANHSAGGLLLEAVVAKADVLACFEDCDEVVVRSGKAKVVSVSAVAAQHRPWAERSDVKID